MKYVRIICRVLFVMCALTGSDAKTQVTVRPPVLTAKLVRSGNAVTHDGTVVRYDIYGRGNRIILFGFPYSAGSPEIEPFIDQLAPQYRLIFHTYPGEPKLYTLTAGTLVADYLRIADAAGAREFAYLGYSWGATIGLQMALRTSRVRALVAGGFPMVDGPYEQIRDTLRWSVNRPSSKWGESRQVLTYYESLVGFDDREIQGKLMIPRLNYLGTRDRVVFPGNVDVEFYRRFAAARQELERLGWATAQLEGADHPQAQRPMTALPIVKHWLTRCWPASSVRSRAAPGWPACAVREFSNPSQVLTHGH